MAADPGLSALEVIKHVTRNPSVPSVGGRVQYGRMVGEEFRVFVIYDHEIDDVTRTIRGGYYLGGVEIMNPGQLPLPAGYLITPALVADPFQRERDEL